MIFIMNCNVASMQEFSPADKAAKTSASANHNAMLCPGTVSRYASSRKREQDQLVINTYLLEVAQEIADPLDVICNRVEEMLGSLQAQLNSRVSRQLNDIVSQVYRISSMAHNLVAIAQQAPQVLARFDVNELVLDAVAVCEQGEGRDLKINLQLAHSLPLIVGDPMSLQTALQSLVRAITEMTGDDAVARIATKRSEEAGQVEILFLGRGFGQASSSGTALEQVLSRAQTIRPGAGLGALIARKIIEAQGGGFSFSSSKENGITIRAILPVMASERA